MTQDTGRLRAAMAALLVASALLFFVRIAIDGTEFRTWCAYDSIGIAAALQTDASIRTDCAVCGTEIALDTHAGRPPVDRPERLWLASGGTDLRGDFCDPTVLL